MSAPISRIVEFGAGRPRIEVMEAGSGPPLLFLHGAGGIPSWDGALPLLARAYRVYAPLLPGFGQSTGLEFLDDQFDLFLHC
jgi:pimeloyl-ACP methyl ester carboxylesterase